MKNCIDIKNVAFSYNGIPVLNDVSLELSSGLNCILGPNGEGKTTLLRCITGYLRPNKGRVMINSKEVSAMKASEIAKKVSLVPQHMIVEFEFTIEEFIMMGRHAYIGRFSKESELDWEIVNEAIKQTGLNKIRKRKVTQLSGGERQRMLIARALCQQADIMLLDEPVTSLDIKHQLDVMGLVKDLVNRQGITALCVLHDFNLAARYADKIILLKNGRVHSVGTPKETLTEESIKYVYGANMNILDIENYLTVVPRINS